MIKRKKNDNIFMKDAGDEISMLAEIEVDPNEEIPVNFDKEIPILPLRNMVMFPSVIMPVTVGRTSSLKLINATNKSAVLYM